MAAVLASHFKILCKFCRSSQCVVSWILVRLIEINKNVNFRLDLIQTGRNVIYNSPAGLFYFLRAPEDAEDQEAYLVTRGQRYKSTKIFSFILGLSTGIHLLNDGAFFKFCPTTVPSAIPRKSRFTYI